MSEHPTYRAVCDRSGSWWAISVPELRGVRTQARRLDQAEAMVREAIALMLDVPEDSFDVVLAPHLPERTELAVDELRRRKGQADAAQRAASEAAVAAAEALVGAGLTVRDAGRVLGVSHQRVAQLLGDRKR
jgi:predicted RNase H-like HicB family nuclease